MVASAARVRPPPTRGVSTFAPTRRPSVSCWAKVSARAARRAPLYGVDLDGNGTRRVYRHTALADELVMNTAWGFALLRNYPTSGFQVDVPGQAIYADEARSRAHHTRSAQLWSCCAALHELAARRRHMHSLRSTRMHITHVCIADAALLARAQLH